MKLAAPGSALLCRWLRTRSYASLCITANVDAPASANASAAAVVRLSGRLHQAGPAGLSHPADGSQQKAAALALNGHLVNQL